MTPTPVWSPDGTRIAFVKATEGYRNIYVMNADGSGQMNLTPGSGDHGPGQRRHEPHWSPDGRQIAYAGTQGDIWVMNADRSGKSNLTDTLEVGEREPAWSPDGTRIAYVRETDIWVMNANGTGQTQLTTTTGAGEDEKAPDWSPDGSQILYGKGSAVWRMNVDGSGTGAGREQRRAAGVVARRHPDHLSSSSYGAVNGPDIFTAHPTAPTSCGSRPPPT